MAKTQPQADPTPAEPFGGVIATSPTAPPHPHPVGTPPGGGVWRWDTQAGRWVSLDAPAAD